MEILTGPGTRSESHTNHWQSWDFHLSSLALHSRDLNTVLVLIRLSERRVLRNTFTDALKTLKAS